MSSLVDSAERNYDGLADKDYILKAEPVHLGKGVVAIAKRSFNTSLFSDIEIHWTYNGNLKSIKSHKSFLYAWGSEWRYLLLVRRKKKFSNFVLIIAL